jgi:aminoglycoside phosphotransferase (APT) family kinase protein
MAVDGADDEWADGAVPAVLKEINDVHGIRLRRVCRLAGGVEGAWLVRGTDGQLAVLKCNADPSRLEQLRATARAVSRARAAGYPTPAWLLVGSTQSVTCYYVQEYVPGEPSRSLTARTAPILLDLLERQAGLNPYPEHDRNTHVRSLLQHRETIRDLGAAGRAFVDHWQRVLDNASAADLPGGDLVHGDFAIRNVLIHRGRVTGAVDIDAIGSGTRVIDYASLLREGYIKGAHPTVLRMIRLAGEAVAGPKVLAFCVAATALGMVEWILRHEPDDAVTVIHRLHPLGDDLARVEP